MEDKPIIIIRPEILEKTGSLQTAYILNWLELSQRRAPHSEWFPYPMNEFSEDSKMSAGTIYRAVKHLEELGWVRSRIGSVNRAREYHVDLAKIKTDLNLPDPY